MRTTVIKFTLCGAAIAAWAAFLYLDAMWNSCLSRAVEDGKMRYGEMYGPLTFFRPVALYVAFSLSLVCGGWLAIDGRKKRI
jgi:hypothetical protein